MSIYQLVKSIRYLALVTLVFLISTLSSNAAYLENIPTVVTNPDGTKIECFSSGDEFFSYLHDEDGFTIIQGEDGFYYYAEKADNKLVASAYRVNSVNPKAKGLLPKTLISPEEYKERVNAFWNGTIDKGAKVPHNGQLNNVVIYIRFNNDTEFTTTRSVYDARFNSPTEASLKHYFDEVSYGELDIESFHYPFCEPTTNLSYQDTYNRSYFQPYNATTNPDGYQNDSQRAQREHKLLLRAVNALENEIPTDLLIDADGDGFVDNVCFIIRGNSEGWADLLWAHRWVLYTENVYIHGKRVWDYTFQPENQAVVGTICHEMFHTLGAPDLYRYSYDGYNPVGPWDIMSSGFSHMSAYMKYKYANAKWVTELPVISEPGEYTLNPLTSNSNQAYRINSPYSSGEFFVVEYRKKTGKYESTLPQSGLLVYRINTAANGNSNGPPDEVYLYRPGGSTTANGNINLAALSADNPYDAIVDGTNFAPFLSNGSVGGIQIVNVSEIDETISFTLINESYRVTFNVFGSDGPLKDARIKFGEEIYTTNSSGRRIINNVFPGVYDYAIKKDGYETRTGSIEVVNQDVNIDEYMTPVSANTIANQHLTLYPNPFNNTFTIMGVQNVSKILITNIIGQQVFELSLNSEEIVHIDTPGMNKGVHLITFIHKDGNKVTRRIIKQ